LGLALLVISILLDIFENNSALNFEAVRALYRDNPVHWVIMTAPFFLGGLFYLTGSMISERELKLEARANYEHGQFSILQNFISDLDNGNLTAHLADAFDNKTVAAQLTRFRNKLVSNKVAEEKRAWESEGLARLGELLRSQKHIDDMADEILQFVIKYCQCNQGSLFIYNETGGEQYLELKACYAYHRKKHVSKTIAVGNGLVGQCFLEKEIILLTEVPKDYVKITSGLGEATPAFLAIVPMKAKDNVMGIIEVASFERLEEHKVRFIEKASHAFASVIESVTTNQNIRHLLNESQQQAEELRAQEEEMRQNVEELHTMQEQLTRQLADNQQIMKSLALRERVLALTTILSESDLFGTITYVNDKFCEVSQYRPDELVGQPHNFVRHPDMPPELFRLMWHTIKKGDVFRGIVKNRKKDGTHYWVDAMIVPVFEVNKIVKYIGARYHIENDAMARKLYQQQLENIGFAEAVVA
jgi:PAS domain S-box-containing protein